MKSIFWTKSGMLSNKTSVYRPRSIISNVRSTSHNVQPYVTTRNDGTSKKMSPRKTKFRVRQKTGMVLGDFMSKEFANVNTNTHTRKKTLPSVIGRSKTSPNVSSLSNPQEASYVTEFPSLPDTAPSAGTSAPMDWSFLRKVTPESTKAIEQMNIQTAIVHQKRMKDQDNRRHRQQQVKFIHKLRKTLAEDEDNLLLDEDEIEKLVIAKVFGDKPDEELYEMYIIDSIHKENPKATEDDLKQMYQDYVEAVENGSDVDDIVC